jgi:hypothetical protein
MTQYDIGDLRLSSAAERLLVRTGRTSLEQNRRCENALEGALYGK